jgi:N-acyl-D-amino-acid deacylase
VLGRYVREYGLLELSAAVRKMSGLAAETFQLTLYGRIESGCRANIVVFNPEKVIDRATFEDSIRYADGIEHVIVEGEPVICYGEQLDRMPGIAVGKRE